MLSVIISVYKDVSALELILLALERQSYRSFEVIIAEDNESKEISSFLRLASYRFPIKHVFQADKGFRKCKILNKAIKEASHERLVFLDGDCIPHPEFLKQYNKNIKKGVFLTGRRTMLSKKISEKLRSTKAISMLRLGTVLFSSSQKKKRALYLPFMPEKTTRGVLGCNMGGMLSDIYKINGFDEDYVNPTVGEDSDLNWRFAQSGVQIKTITHKAIVYHLYHKPSYSDTDTEHQHNLAMMNAKKQANTWFCLNGLKKKEDES